MHVKRDSKTFVISFYTAMSIPDLPWVCFPLILYFPATNLKGTGKRGHIVADTLLPTQMFPRLPARATFVADTKFVSGTQKKVSDFVQKHFVSATNVSQFAQPKKHHEQQCVRNNVSSFAINLSSLSEGLKV